MRKAILSWIIFFTEILRHNKKEEFYFLLCFTITHPTLVYSDMNIICHNNKIFLCKQNASFSSLFSQKPTLSTNCKEMKNRLNACNTPFPIHLFSIMSTCGSEASLIISFIGSLGEDVSRHPGAMAFLKRVMIKQF